jgi:hypothetical protein
MEEMRNAYILMGIPGRRRPCGKLRRRWEDDIKVNLKDPS